MNADILTLSQNKKELMELITRLKQLTGLLYETICKSYGVNNAEISSNSSNDLSKVIFNSFNISDVKINNPFIAAPMAGISDNAYRVFAKFLGCSLVFSEMATSYGLKLKHEKSFDITRLTDFERPCAVQIFGNDPDIITEAAIIIEENADIIDVNMGCPVPKVLKTKSGGYLLNEPETIRRIVKKLKEKIKKSVTVKLRIGWDENNINVLDIAKIVEGEGVDAVSIHGRTVKQGYSGKTDYEYIKKVKSIVKIPVIASGDIQSAYKARQVLDYTGCDGLMVGRAARGNPWIFSELLLGLLKISRKKEKIDGRKAGRNPKSYENDPLIDNFILSNDIKVQAMKLYLKFLIHFKGEDRAVRESRKMLGWAFKGQRDITSIRNSFFKINSFNDAEEILEGLR
ncbi:MAG: tRNA dihydrouridine synthase [Candidatus Humimicrobiaceae bacterium]